MADIIVGGFYLVMVFITPEGNVMGEVLDHYNDPYECVINGTYEESEAPLGVGYVCIEDVIYKDGKDAG